MDVVFVISLTPRVWESCNTGDDKFTDFCKRNKPVKHIKNQIKKE